MKLIIEIPLDLYERCKRGDYELFDDSIRTEAIANGTPYVVDCKNCDGYEAGYSAGVRDTERPQGEWVAIEPYTHKTFCPFCKEDTRFEVGKYDNFCPNCGAKMVSSEKTQEV